MKNKGKLKRIGIIAKEKHPAIAGLLQQVVCWAREQGIALLATKSVAQKIGCQAVVDTGKLAAHSDLLLVLGGDGTLLTAARAAGKRQTPILGINLGSLGYLTEFTMQELIPALESIRNDSHQVQERVMLSVRLLPRQGKIRHHLALNEAVIHNGVLARIMDLEIRVDGEFVTNSRSDGLIISTPTGSTAYSLSAGGPILQPDLNAVILTPICPHTLSNRPIVLNDTVSIQVVLQAGDNAMLTIDGQVGETLAIGDRVSVCKAPFATRLIKPPNKNHFLILRQKLHWGEHGNGAGLYTSTPTVHG